MRKNDFEETMSKIKYAIYTQSCTMNHQDNTEYEKGMIRGLNLALSIIRKYADINYEEGK